MNVNKNYLGLKKNKMLSPGCDSTIARVSADLNVAKFNETVLQETDISAANEIAHFAICARAANQSNPLFCCHV